LLNLKGIEIDYEEDISIIDIVDLRSAIARANEKENKKLE
jgi:hypothetical protein